MTPACSALLAKFSTAETSDGALARTIKSGAWVRMVKRIPSRNAGRSHCATCSSSALTLTTSRAAPPCANASMSFTSLSSCFRLPTVFSAQRTRSAVLRGPKRHLRGVQKRGGQRRANLMGQSRGQFAQGEQALLPGQKYLHQVRFGHVRQQHHLAAILELALRYVDEPAAAQFRVFAGAPGADAPRAQAPR